MRIRYLLLTTILLIFGCNALAQSSLNIEVRDSLSKGVLPYVSLYLGMGKRNIGGICDSLGKFQAIVKGQKSIEVRATYLGFRNKEISIEVDKDTSVIIFLNPTDELLKDVVIKGEQVILENRADRTVLNLRQSKKESVLEAIRNIPSLIVINDEIQIDGKSDYIIYKDGIPTNLTAKDLRNMPVSLLESAELIYYPSSKYDNEAGKVINIITKKEELFLGGNIWGRGGVRSKAGLGSYGSGLNLSRFLGSSNTTFSINTTSDIFVSGYTSNLQILGDNVFSEANTTSKSPDYIINFGQDFKLENKQILSFSFNGKINRNSTEAENTVQSFGHTEAIINNSTNSTDGFGLSLNYVKTFKKNKGKVFLSNLYQNEYTNSEIVSERKENEIINSYKNRTRQFNHQVDFEIPLGNNILSEFGVGYKSRRYLQYIDYTELENVDFKYTQDVIASFLSFSKTIAKVFFRFGLRYEHTQNNINSSTKINQDNILPKVLLSYNHSKNVQLSFIFFQDLKRPGFNLLSQYIDISNPTNSVFGNSNLENVVGSNYELKNMFKIGKANLTYIIFANYTKDAIVSLRSIGEFGNLTTSYYNIGRIREYGNRFSFNTPFFGKKVFLVSSGTLRWVRANSSVQNNSGLIKSFNIGGNYKVNSKISMEFFANWLENKILVQGNFGNSIYSDLSLRYSPSKKYSFAVRCQNPLLNKINTTFYFMGDGFSQNSNRHYYGRTIEFSFNYIFGKVKNLSLPTKELNNDDLKNKLD